MAADLSGQPASVGELCRRAVELTRDEGLRHASVWRHRRGRPAGAVHETDEAARGLAQLHESLGEGPAVLAVDELRPVMIADLMSDPVSQRWVLFTHEAVRLGVRSVYSFPLRVGAICLGVFTLHGERPAALEPRTLGALLGLRSALTGILLAPAGGSGDGWADLLTPDHAVTHQAAGRAMVQLGGTIEDALVRIRAHAMGTGQSVAEVATQIVQGTLRFDSERFDSERFDDIDFPPGSEDNDKRGRE